MQFPSLVSARPVDPGTWPGVRSSTMRLSRRSRGATPSRAPGLVGDQADKL